MNNDDDPLLLFRTSDMDYDDVQYTSDGTRVIGRTLDGDTLHILDSTSGAMIAEIIAPIPPPDADGQHMSRSIRALVASKHRPDWIVTLERLRREFDEDEDEDDVEDRFVCTVRNLVEPAQANDIQAIPVAFADDVKVGYTIDDRYVMVWTDSAASVDFTSFEVWELVDRRFVQRFSKPHAFAWPSPDGSRVLLKWVEVDANGLIVHLSSILDTTTLVETRVAFGRHQRFDHAVVGRTTLFVWSTTGDAVARLDAMGRLTEISLERRPVSNVYLSPTEQSYMVSFTFNYFVLRTHGREIIHRQNRGIAYYAARFSNDDRYLYMVQLFEDDSGFVYDLALENPRPVFDILHLANVRFSPTHPLRMVGIATNALLSSDIVSYDLVSRRTIRETNRQLVESTAAQTLEFQGSRGCGGVYNIVNDFLGYRYGDAEANQIVSFVRGVTTPPQLPVSSNSSSSNKRKRDE